MALGAVADIAYHAGPGTRQATGSVGLISHTVTDRNGLAHTSSRRYSQHLSNCGPLSLPPASSATVAGRSTQFDRRVHRSTCRAERRRFHRIGEGRDSWPLDCATAQGWRLHQLRSQIGFYARHTEQTPRNRSVGPFVSVAEPEKRCDKRNITKPGNTILTIGHGARSEAESHDSHFHMSQFSNRPGIRAIFIPISGSTPKSSRAEDRRFPLP